MYLYIKIFLILSSTNNIINNVIFNSTKKSFLLVGHLSLKIKLFKQINQFCIIVIKLKQWYLQIYTDRDNINELKWQIQQYMKNLRFLLRKTFKFNFNLKFRLWLCRVARRPALGGIVKLFYLLPRFTLKYQNVTLFKSKLYK